MKNVIRGAYKVVFGTVAFFVGLAVLVGILAALAPNGTHSAPSVHSVPTNEAASIPDVGSTVTLDNGRPEMTVAFSEAALDELDMRVAAHDTVGLERMVRSGQIGFAPQHSKALVIGVGFLNAHCRLLDGEHSGKEIYVAREWVR